MLIGSQITLRKMYLFKCLQIKQIQWEKHQKINYF